MLVKLCGEPFCYFFSVWGLFYYSSRILQSHLWKLVEFQEVLLISSEYFKKYSATNVHEHFN